MSDVTDKRRIEQEEMKKQDALGVQQYLTGKAAAEQAASNLLLMYPKLANHPGFVQEIVSYAQAHQNTISPIWFLERAQQLGINLTGGGGGFGRSAADKANSIRSFSAAIINAAGQFGIDMSPELVAYIAEVADAQNFSMDQLNDVILNEANWDALKPGVLSVGVERIQETARQYLLDISVDTMRDYSKRIASGESSLEAVESLIKAQAKASNPWMATYIDEGLTPAELLASSRDRIARSLGITASEVDFMDDRFMKMATATDDKGQTRLANSSELTKNIRSDSQWATTEEAKQVTSALAQSIARIFGRSAI